jgi:predicted nucleotidyltransferase
MTLPSEAQVKTWTPLLLGTVGSTAYGLATPESDVDTLGVAAAPTREVLSLHPPRDKTASIVGTEPDVTIHEIGKYLALALKANPTVTELLWLPEDCYREKHPLFVSELIDLRKSLLGARAVRNAYLGYAASQFKKMAHRSDGTFSSDTRGRVAKHARHLMRLLTQGTELFVQGEMSVRLTNPQDYHDFGQLVQGNPERGLETAKQKLATAEHIFDTYTSALPEEPDAADAERVLLNLRIYFLNQEI